MNNPPEKCSLDEVLSRLSESRPVRFMSTCDSTNRVARHALMEGAEPGLLVLSEHQSAGRGRQGRHWEADSGTSLLFSLVLQPRVSADRVARCVLLWAAAMAEVLDCRLKWPNDLQDQHGLKLGGLLAELVAPSASLPEDWWVVLGIGINVNQLEFPQLPDATSLRRVHGCVQDRGEILSKLVQAIEAVDPMAPAGLERWRKRANTLGRRVRVGQVEGLAEDIREDGALVIDGHPVLAGDVEMLSSARSGSGC